jgi:ribonucleoside-diphosphate reductase alpha chain
MVEERKISVIKRDGTKESLNLEKIHLILDKACHGITGVSVSDIAMKARLSLHDGITTKNIHASLIKSAADLISENSTNYQYVAGNLLNYEIRKQAWGGMNPPRLYDHIKKMIDNDYYDAEILNYYSESDWDKINDMIDHDRDFKMTYIGVKEYMTKYAMRDRSSDDVQPLETPQLTYIMIAVLSTLDTKSLKDVKAFYNDYSFWDTSLPTPIMAGLRSPTKQFSSCTLISSDDTLKSITASAEAISLYAAKRAGIGIDGSRLRAEGSSVGKEKSIKHTGVMPFFRSWEGSLKSCAQGGIRGASATLTATLWHLEIEHILVLKNNKGTPDTRVRKLDYSIQINNYLYNRFIHNKDITLFSPSDVPGLYDAFFSDKKKFAKLYEKYEADPSIRKKTVSSSELFAQLMVERKETGRIYIFNVDNVNSHNNFNKPITTSNLCQEITLPTVPMATFIKETLAYPISEFAETMQILNKDYTANYKVTSWSPANNMFEVEVTKDMSEIALCTLAAINLGNVKSLDNLESVCRNTVRMLDNLLDYQDYMVPAARTSTMKYRPLGIGITNLAYYLAKNGVTYSSTEGHKLIHDTMEAISFYCIKASIELAKERGTCLAYNDTKWSQGLMPIDHYNKNVDEIIPNVLNLDWEWLREELKKYGIRNATLTAMMPAESSSKIFNSTNGVEPVRSLITTKGNKHNISRQVVPEFMRLKNKYDMLWDMRSMDGVIKTMAIIQKFTCQSISTNLSYNPAHFDDNEMPLSLMLDDLLKANYYGLKTLYYHNTRDGREDEVTDEKKTEQKEEVKTLIAEGMAEIEADHSCDSCTI